MFCFSHVHVILMEHLKTSVIFLLGTVPVNWTISITCIYVIFQPCDCDPHGSFDNNCDPLTGQCACKLDYNGTQCDSCLFGFYGFPDCQLCLCSVEGTNPKSCDSDGACRCANADGQCNCKVSRSSLLPHSPQLPLLGPMEVSIKLHTR